MPKDLIDEYLKEKLGLRTPIVTFIHHITYLRLYEILKNFPKYLEKQKSDNIGTIHQSGIDGRNKENL
jgi:hypothetical protein